MLFLEKCGRKLRHQARHALCDAIWKISNCDQQNALPSTLYERRSDSSECKTTNQILRVKEAWIELVGRRCTAPAQVRRSFFPIADSFAFRGWYMAATAAQRELTECRL